MIVNHLGYQDMTQKLGVYPMDTLIVVLGINYDMILLKLINHIL